MVIERIFFPSFFSKWNIWMRIQFDMYTLSNFKSKWCYLCKECKFWFCSTWNFLQYILDVFYYFFLCRSVNLELTSIRHDFWCDAFICVKCTILHCNYIWNEAYTHCKIHWSLKYIFCREKYKNIITLLYNCVN